MKNRRNAAFTLVEMLIACVVGGVLGGIIYTVASEGLTSFARNASLNRGYTDARNAIDQITASVQSAGNAPVLVDANGAVTTASQAEGVRFYRYGSLPTYEIPSGKTSDNFLVVNYLSSQAVINGGSPINVGDLVTIPLLGFQATVAGVTVTPGVTTSAAKLTFDSSITTLRDGCSPKPASVLNLGPDTTTTPTTYYSALVFRQVLFVAVPNLPAGTGAQLRYYPQAMSTGSGNACGNLTAFNSSAAFSSAKNYQVMAAICGSVTDTTLTPLKPFLDPDASNVLKMVLCAEGPEYNNRNLGASNTYSFMQSSMGSRCPKLLRSMTVPF